ncbi:MAG: response regulator [Candidatus Hodarchaeales archaeon]|jgi:CheY-like chemotaxis protein
MPDFRVLIVEDDEDLREGIIVLIKRLLPNINFFGAENGLDAIRIITEEGSKFDLIVSDIFMPKISGYELAKYMNSNNIFVTLIALTGEEVKDDILFEAGFSKILRKSVNFHEILEELYDYIVSLYESERILRNQPKFIS